MPADILIDDTSWSDFYGHDCEWYQYTRMTRKNVCKDPEAKKNCRLGCFNTPCFRGVPANNKTRYLWKHVSRMQVGACC